MSKKEPISSLIQLPHSNIAVAVLFLLCLTLPFLWIPYVIYYYLCYHRVVVKNKRLIELSNIDIITENCISEVSICLLKFKGRFLFKSPDWSYSSVEDFEIRYNEDLGWQYKIECVKTDSISTPGNVQSPLEYYQELESLCPSENPQWDHAIKQKYLDWNCFDSPTSAIINYNYGLALAV